MTTIQHARPEVRTRADSFSRMLELEKKYKMQRLQDTGSSSPLTRPGLAITREASSAQPNMALKARRASAHPQVSQMKSHMMNATHRSSDLPSLSISVPPSSTLAVAVRADGSRDRTKTVKFSHPEEEGEGGDEDEDEEAAGLSDQSSICQSPSWAVYGQNKKKDKKREAAQKKKEQERQEKANKNSKKSRLSKATPPSNPEVRFLATTNRSPSVPNLEQNQKFDKRSLTRSTSQYPPDSMASHHNLLRQSTSDGNSRPKSRGLFSSFRLSQSNTGAAQRSEAGSRMSMDDSSSLRSGSPFATQILGPRGEMDFLNPRKPPSIRSTQSSSTQSQTSQESKNRKSFSHGRSHSLLSRLRGPSYLYAKSPESSEEVANKHPEIPKGIETTTENLGKSQGGKDTVPVVDVPQKKNDQEPKTHRGRQAQAHIPQPRESSSDYEEEEEAANDSHHHDVRRPMADTPATNEGRHQASAHLSQAGHQLQEPVIPAPQPQPSDQTGDYSDRIQETRRNFARLNQPASRAQHQVAVLDQPTPTMSPQSEESYATAYTDAVEQLSESHSAISEVDQSFIRTYTSASRSSSGEDERNELEPTKELTTSLAPPHSYRIGNQADYSKITISSKAFNSPFKAAVCLDQLTMGQKSQEVHVPVMPADYFTFVSEAYVPPSLELRSPMDGDFYCSHVIEEEPNGEVYEDEDEDEDPAWAGLPIESPEHEQYAPVEAVGEEVQNGSTKSSRFTDLCDSPTLSPHDASDVPEFDSLSPPLTAVKPAAKPQSPRAFAEDEGSRTVSERSSSTCNDLLNSPLTATTPDTSRPQSQKGTTVDMPKSVPNAVKLEDERPARELHCSKVLDSTKSRSTSQDPSIENAASDRRAQLADLTEHGRTGLITPGSVVSSPSLRGSPMLTACTPHLTEDTAGENITSAPRRQPLAPKAQSAIDLTTVGSSTWGRQPLALRESKAAFSSVSLPSSPPPESEIDVPAPRRSALRMPRNNSASTQGSSNGLSAGAAYLQEARKAAPIPPASSSRALRAANPSRPPIPYPKISASSETMGEPIAKVLVQCCSCNFFHDMPSRVYECMAKPDSIVEDKNLGVSAAITTTVKCPWCAHGMTTQCCSGYAAMVYLKEKLHGR